MTHAPHFPAGMMHVQLSAAVLDDGRFVASASSAHSRIAAIVAGSSIATTVSLSADTLRCSSAPSDARAETPFRIPSTDTLGFAAAIAAVSVLACYREVDSVDELLDLDRGSWEGSLPDSSSLGGDGTPLRGAFIIDSAFLTGGSRTHCGKNSINFARMAHSHRHRLAAAWPSLVRQIGPVLRRRRHRGFRQKWVRSRLARDCEPVSRVPRSVGEHRQCNVCPVCLVRRW